MCTSLFLWWWNAKKSSGVNESRIDIPRDFAINLVASECFNRWPWRWLHTWQIFVHRPVVGWYFWCRFAASKEQTLNIFNGHSPLTTTIHPSHLMHSARQNTMVKALDTRERLLYLGLKMLKIKITDINFIGSLFLI